MSIVTRRYLAQSTYRRLYNFPSFGKVGNVLFGGYAGLPGHDRLKKSSFVESDRSSCTSTGTRLVWNRERRVHSWKMDGRQRHLCDMMRGHNYEPRRRITGMASVQSE